MQKSFRKLKPNDRVVMEGGFVKGTVRLRTRAGGNVIYLVEWDNIDNPTFEQRSHLRLL